MQRVYLRLWEGLQRQTKEGINIDRVTEETMIKEIKRKGRVVIRFDLLPQMFSNEGEVRRFLSKHHLKLLYKRDVVILKGK